MPALKKPVPTSTEDIPRSSRKRTLNPKLTTEDNVHPEANDIKRRKLEAGASLAGSQSNSNKKTVKPPAKRNSRPKSQVKSRKQQPCIEVEDDDDEVMIINDEEEKHEEKDNNESQEDKDSDNSESQKEDVETESEEDVESQEELDRKELGMLHPPFEYSPNKLTIYF
jgi:hypothetical protein